MALPPLGPSGREADDAQWLELTGKSGMAINVSPVHRLRISGPGPAGLAALPKDNRPPNMARGEAILSGKWKFGAAHIEVALTCHNLGVLLHARGERSPAAELLERALEIFTRSLAESHPSVQNCRQRLQSLRAAS